MVCGVHATPLEKLLDLGSLIHSSAVYKPTKCIERPVYLLNHCRGLWNCWRDGRLVENKRQEIFQRRLISRVIFINKYTMLEQEGILKIIHLM